MKTVNPTPNATYLPLLLAALVILLPACESPQHATHEQPHSPITPIQPTADTTAPAAPQSPPGRTAVGAPVEAQRVDWASIRSPSGWAITVWGPSDVEGALYFLEGQKVVNRYYEESALLGEWQLSGRNIEITYTQRYFRKGVGEPLAPPTAVAGNYIPQYATYSYEIEPIDLRETYDWEDMRSGLAEDNGDYEAHRQGLRPTDLDALLDLRIVLE